jgi:hypothetical protein
VLVLPVEDTDQGELVTAGVRLFVPNLRDDDALEAITLGLHRLDLEPSQRNATCHFDDVRFDRTELLQPSK